MIEHSFSRNVHNERRLLLELTSGTDIFRFAVNMLHMQSEFCEVAHFILVELRESSGEGFDEWGKSMLGEERFERLKPYFYRDTHCCVCEQMLDDGEGRKLARAQIVCKSCDVGEDAS